MKAKRVSSYHGKPHWNGEPCKARRVIIRVTEPPVATWWYKHLVGTEMRAVEVEYYDQKFLLADQDGNGWHKVMIEGGGPHHGHSSVTGDILRERTEFDGDDCHCAERAS